MEKEFVPYVLSKQIKQLGFKEECLGYYVDVEVANPFLVINRINDTQGGYFTLAPTFSQTFRWFREKYNIIPNIHSVYIDETHTKINFWVWFANYEENSNEEIYYGTYEEAELECLKKLIEIVKDGKK